MVSSPFPVRPHDGRRLIETPSITCIANATNALLLARAPMHCGAAPSPTLHPRSAKLTMLSYRSDHHQGARHRHALARPEPQRV